MHTSLAARVPEALPSRFRSSPCLNCFTTVTVVFASGLNAVFRLSSHANATGAAGPAGGGDAGMMGSTAPDEPPLPPARRERRGGAQAHAHGGQRRGRNA